MDDLFEDYDNLSKTPNLPKIYAVFPNIFTKTSKTEYQFYDVDRFLNDLIFNWVKKNKNQLKENTEEYLWNNLEDFFISKEMLKNRYFVNFFGTKKLMLAYSRLITHYDHGSIIYHLNKLLDLMDKNFDLIDRDFFEEIIHGHLFYQFYTEIEDPYTSDFAQSEGTLNILKRVENLKRKLCLQ